MSGTRAIRVAVNTLAVSDANEGTRTVLCHLLPALQRVAPEISQVLICTPKNRHLFGHDAEVIEIPLDHRRAVRRILADQVTVPRLVRGRADVLVTPSSVGSLRSPLPQVVIVPHHLALPSCRNIAGPGTVGLSHRAYYGPVLSWSLRRADAVLGISRFVADGLVDELGVDSRKVAAMALGVDTAIRGKPAAGREPMTLFVGTLYPYKDAVIAVHAFARARVALPAGASLVVVGRDPDGQQIPTLERVVAKLGIDDSVSLAGPVSGEDLVDLYQRAGVLVMPSRCEGFGLPILEAMAHGTPVIAADATSLAEVTEGAGVLVPPGDIDGFATAIVAVLTDPGYCSDLVERGRRRAGAMTWDATADHLRAAVHRIVA